MARRRCRSSGLAAATAAAYAVREAVWLPNRVVLALALLALAGVVVDVLTTVDGASVVLAIPGAVVLDSAPAPSTCAGCGSWSSPRPSSAAWRSRRSIDDGPATDSAPPLVALWAAGAYMTVPDTEAALAILGATLVVAAGAWPLRLGCVGACGALPMAGLMAWTRAVRRHGSAEFDRRCGRVHRAAAVEPATRALRRGDAGPIDVFAKPTEARWWTLPAVAPIQLVLVFVAGPRGRIGSPRRSSAVAIVVAEGIVALTISLLVTWRYARKAS